MESIVYFDAEIGAEDHKIHNIGALRDGETFHSASVGDFALSPLTPAICAGTISSIMI